MNIEKLLPLAVLTLTLAASPARAAVHTEAVRYRAGDTELEGWLVYDDAVSGQRPGVLVAHQWMGLTDYEKQRAEMLAKLGYVAFCADIYGSGVRPRDTAEAGALAGKYKNDRPLLRARLTAALEVLQRQPQVDRGRIGAMGYCFGGTAVLELARAGAEIRGVVSFHGGLGAPASAASEQIRGAVLALHGADDPFVPAAEVAAFEAEMRRAGADWQLVSYGGAVHSFTHWTAGSDNSKGAAYNEKADRRSWAAMRNFFEELFAAKAN